VVDVERASGKRKPWTRCEGRDVRSANHSRGIADSPEAWGSLKCPAVRPAETPQYLEVGGSPGEEIAWLERRRFSLAVASWDPCASVLKLWGESSRREAKLAIIGPLCRPPQRLGGVCRLSITSCGGSVRSRQFSGSSANSRHRRISKSLLSLRSRQTAPLSISGSIPDPSPDLHLPRAAVRIA